jgi:hypothetical protein
MEIEEILIGSSLEAIVADMNRISPKSKYSNGASYEHIVTEYLNRCVIELLYNLDNNNQIPEISLVSIKSKFTYRYNRNNYWWDYLSQNYPLWIEIQKGYNVSDNNKQLTQIKPLVSISDLLHYRMNTDFGDYFRASVDVNNNLVKTPINTQSLLAGIQIFARNKQYKQMVLCQNILDQQVSGYILSNAEIKPNVLGMGRMYMSGANNLQGIKKSVREAALGKCYRYDIKSSVFAYMHNQIKQQDPDIKTPHIMELLDRKDYIRNKLATECLINTNATPDMKLKLIKSSITALSFGSNPHSWSSGIAEHIYHNQDRHLFATHPFIKGLLKEIKIYQNIIRELYPRKEYPGVKLVTLCSNHYQNTEALAIRHIISETQTEPVLIVHDCIYTKHRIDSIYATVLLQDIMGPGATFECVELIDWYDPAQRTQHNTQQTQHQSRITAEEQLARNYVSDNNIIQHTSQPDKWDSRYATQQASQQLMQEEIYD